MNRRTALAALLAAALWAPFASAQVKTQLPTAKHFLWEVSSLSNTVYLFGTVHAGKKAWYPLPDVVEDAMEESPVLVVEADILDTAALSKTAGAFSYEPPDQLKNHVPAAAYADFLKLLPRYGVAESQLSSMKPFVAISTLVFGEWGRNGYQAQWGVDAYLLRKAKGERKRIVELEGVEAQAKLMQSLTEAQSSAVFEGTVKALDSGLTSDQIKGLVTAWQEGDPNGLLAVARRYNEQVPGAKEFEEKFIWSRHEEMVKKIEGFLAEQNKPHFIAVGALHLAGERGLVQLLRARGHKVVQK